MMIKSQEVLSFLVKRDRNSPVAKADAITTTDYSTHYKFSEERILLIIYAIVTLDENEDEPVLFHTDSFRRQITALFDELYNCDQEPEKQFQTLALFLNSKSQETEIIFHSILPLLISSMHHST